MERRYILAFTLSLLILIGYPYLISRIYGPQGQENAEIGPYEEYEEEVTKAPFIPVTPSIPPPTLASQVVEEAIKHPLFLETETLELFLHPRNGSIQQIFLKEYLDDED